MRGVERRARPGATDRAARAGASGPSPTSARRSSPSTQLHRQVEARRRPRPRRRPARRSGGRSTAASRDSRWKRSGTARRRRAPARAPSARRRGRARCSVARVDDAHAAAPDDAVDAIAIELRARLQFFGAHRRADALRAARFLSSSPACASTEHEFAVPLDHAAPDGEQITVFAREVADPDGARPAVPRLPPGRARASRRRARRGTRAAPGWLDRALRGLPRADARPARHRPLDAGRHAARPDAGRAGRVPDALPRRLDRARRRAASARALGRRALERARAELRRLLRR